MKFPKTTRERFLAADFPVKLHATCVDNPVDKQEEKNSFEREGESGYLRSTRRSLAHLLQASTGLGARGLGATNLDLQRQLGLDEMSGPVLFVRSVEPKTLDQKL